VVEVVAFQVDKALEGRGVAVLLALITAMGLLELLILVVAVAVAGL
jgi:hypothetical protein